MDNWCEYVAQNGEVKHVLQLFCECEDLDETLTSFVMRPRSHLRRPCNPWQRVLAAAQDRARLPWPGGARRIDLSWLLAAALLSLVWRQARTSNTSFAAEIYLVACFAGLAFSHLWTLKRRSKSQFLMAWLTLSVLGSYLKYRAIIRHTLTWTADAMAHATLLTMAACFLHCCIADPGRDTMAGGPVAQRRDVSPDVGLDEDLHDDTQRSKRLRSGRCTICGCTFRLRDHHCVWVGQCIAERNRRSFLLFLVLLSWLSLWFAYKMALLAATALDCCHREVYEKLWPVYCVVREHRGGELVTLGLYAFVGGCLMAALALQQCLLVGAGVTTLEVRRKKFAESSGAAGGTPSAHSVTEPICSPQEHDSASSLTRATSLPLVVFPRPTIFIGNWARFIAGTELPARSSLRQAFTMPSNSSMLHSSSRPGLPSARKSS